MASRDIPASTVDLAEPAARAVVQRRAIAANAGIVLLSYVTGGLTADLLQLYALQVLHLTPTQLGVALGLLLLSIPPQLRAATHLVPRLGKKRLMLIGYTLAAVLLVPFALLPTIVDHRVAVFCGFCATVVLFEIVISCSWGVAWHAWMRELTLPAERGRFLSRMRFASSGFNFAVTLIFSLVVGATVSAREYDGLLVASGAFLLFSLSQLRLLPADTAEKSGPAANELPSTRRQLQAVLAPRKIRLLGAVFALDMFTIVPLFVTYANRNLGYTASSIALILSIRGGIGIASLLVWGRIIDRFTAPVVMRACLIALALVMLSWLFVRPSDGIAVRSVVMGAVVIGSAVLTGGYGIAGMSTLYGAVESETSATLFALRDVLESAKFQFFIFVSGLAISLLGNHRIYQSRLIELDGYKLFILLSVPACLIGAVLLTRLIDSPAES